MAWVPSVLIALVLLGPGCKASSNAEAAPGRQGSGQPDTRTQPPKHVGLDHVQLRAYITYKPTGDKGNEVKRTFLRFKEAGIPDAGFFPAKPSASVPDTSARFFSDIVGDTLIECFYASMEAIGDVIVMASAYCIQTRGADGSGFGTYVEATATCGLTPGGRGGSRTNFVIFDEKRVVASSAFTLGFDCEVLTSRGTLPAKQVAVPSAARTSPTSSVTRPSTTQPRVPSRPVVPSSSDSGIVISAANDETFLIETTSGRRLYKAKTYCFGINDGDVVVFSESPSVCVANTFIDRTSGKTCEVWCE